jgi:hypothetical protein
VATTLTLAGCKYSVTVVVYVIDGVPWPETIVPLSSVQVTTVFGFIGPSVMVPRPSQAASGETSSCTMRGCGRYDTCATGCGIVSSQS